MGICHSDTDSIIASMRKEKMDNQNNIKSSKSDPNSKSISNQNMYDSLCKTTFENAKINKLEGNTHMCKILNVYDGDTFTIGIADMPDEKFSIRLYGIDTPEIKPLLSIDDRDLHKKAANVCRQIVISKFNKVNNIVWVKFMHREKYGRELGVIYLYRGDKIDDKDNLADILITEEIGLEYTGKKKNEFSKSFLLNIIKKMDEYKIDPNILDDKIKVKIPKQKNLKKDE